tara:strand:- start:187 stop:744 length:558 start_codon:yes stop_codon:yes gene_type:complete
MGYSMKGFGKPKITNDSNNMTKSAAVKMDGAALMQYAEKQTRGVEGKRPDYEIKDGQQAGIIMRRGTEQSGVYRPTEKAYNMVKNNEGELFKPGALDDYKGSVSKTKDGRIRGYKDSEGVFTRFTNPTTEDRLTPKQKTQLKKFRRTRDDYNADILGKKEYIRKVKGYTGKYKVEAEPIQKKYKK